MTEQSQPTRRTVLKGAAALSLAGAAAALPAHAAPGAPAPAPSASPLAPPAIGTARPRLEGLAKVTGRADYAADEQPPRLVHGVAVLATVSKGRVVRVDQAAVLGMPGVLGVLDHTNAPRLNPEAGGFFGPEGGLQVFQGTDIPFAGRPVALVVAETLEQAQAAAQALPVTYEELPHDTSLSAEHPRRRKATPFFGPDATVGDADAELAASAVVVDQRYRTPEANHSALEPHAATAWWADGRLEAVDSNQGPHIVATALASLFRLDPATVRVRAEHVGGGFGGKGGLGPQLILATMATTHFQRPVRVALTRPQVFLATASRPATDQRVVLGARPDGRLRVIQHEATFSISTIAEYLENCAELSKLLYAAPAIRTRLHVVELDLLPPTSMRGPGATTGSFALESAVDELAAALHLDPVELRLRNEPAVAPVSGLPWASRNLAGCLREGAKAFGWSRRPRAPRQRREGEWLIGTGVACSSFGTGAFPSTASITAERDGGYTVAVGAVDIGTGARTALTAVAADVLGVPVSRIRIRIADSDLGMAWGAGGSLGTTSWSWAIVAAAEKLREALAGKPQLPVTARGDTTELLGNRPPAERHSFGAVFTEVAVSPVTGEVRVRRLLGRYAVGRVVNPLTARSQLSGGMIMGLSMALHEESVRDARTGRQINADWAGYHISAHADIPDIDVDFVPDHEPDDPHGLKGVGEIGTVGTAAAIANAVWHATGTRHRTLPIRLDRVLEA